jgi:hypothetical protein
MSEETINPGFCIGHSGVAESIINLKKSDVEQWEHITKIEAILPKLVPVWVTIILMVMSALTGSALTFAGMIFKFTGK